MNYHCALTRLLVLGLLFVFVVCDKVSALCFGFKGVCCRLCLCLIYFLFYCFCLCVDAVTLRFDCFEWLFGRLIICL